MGRHQWVDNAKAMGMFLVYYGHIVEGLYRAGNTSAFVHFKLIYAFHIPLFFLMARFFAKIQWPTPERFRRLALRRILPVLTFGAMLLPMWLLHYYHSLEWGNFVWQCLDYFHGAPELNLITWFLVCLFSCEVLASVCLPLLKERLRVVFFAVICLVGGLLVCQHMLGIVRIFGISKNTWFIHEAFVALGFYSLGYAVFLIVSNSMAFRSHNAMLYHGRLCRCDVDDLRPQ